MAVIPPAIGERAAGRKIILDNNAFLMATKPGRWLQAQQKGPTGGRPRFK